MTFFEGTVFVLYCGAIFWIFAAIAFASDYKAKRLELTEQQLADFKRIWDVDPDADRRLDDAEDWDRRKAAEENQ